ncbi:MAG: DUF2092 domain-containing protein [Gemmatimonadaceae bacterium]
MRRAIRRASYSAIAVVVLGAALVRPGAFTVGGPGPAAADTVAAIDQGAMDALENMGRYLRTLNTFQVRAAVTTEEVLLDGEKVQLSNVADLVARKPDQLRATVISDRQERLFLYDGKSFTLFAPRSNYFATVPAPPTIRELVTELETRYGIELPFVDLFRWGTPESNAKEITSATHVGPSEIDGTKCDHYAFRQPGLDWQIWIQRGDFPLPRRLVLTTLTDEARPQHVSNYTWNLAPAVDSAAFAFAPPKDARKISFVDVTTARATLRREDAKK